MANHITTRIQLSSELCDKLNEAAHTLHCGKNWIIVRALEVYLNQPLSDLFIEEARRQSLLISQSDDPAEMDLWEKNIDTTGWE